MASYPGSKVHRPSRRNLGRGQHVQLPSADVVVTSAMATATLTFSVPIIANGSIPLNVTGGLTLVSQEQTAPNVVVQVYSGALSGEDYSYPGNDQTVRTFQGGGCNPAAGTFS